MKDNINIYITFAEEIKNSNSELSDYIDQVITNLELSFKRITDTGISVLVKGKDFTTENHVKALKNCAHSVVFIHSQFIEDVEYQIELARICEQAEESGDKKKIFKICMEPLKKELSPAYLEELESYDFYEKNVYNRRTKRLDFSSSETLDSIYGKLLDLSFDVVKQIQPENSLANQDEKYAYVGLTTFDQQNARDSIRRELQHYGYQILPSKKMPVTGEEFKNALEGYLQKVSLVVQIMGTQYGDNLKGTKYSISDYQNQIIREFQQNDSEQSFHRLIWIPQNSKISDQRQALYLKRIRRDDAIENTEIIESQLVSFKKVLADRVDGPKKVTKEEISDNISSVYLLAEEDAMEAVSPIYSSLAESGLKVYTLDYGEQSGIYTRHLNALRDANAVVIYQKSEHVFWLSSKLRDLVKAPGMGRKTPYKKVVLVTSVLPDAQLVRMIKTNVEVIEDIAAKPDLILKKLITE